MKPFSRNVVSILLGLTCLAAWGNGMPSVEPEAVGFSSERLDRLTGAMRKHLEEGHFTGAVAAIARKGKIAYFETFGDQDREEAIAMDEDTIFRIYSMSKAITGVAVMMLYEEGHFFLNDPVSKYLPAFRGQQVAVEGAENAENSRKRKSKKNSENEEKALETVSADREMTIRDLLRHTSGITYGSPRTKTGHLYREAGVGDRDITIEEMVKRLGTVPLEFHPGTNWQYGLSIDVLGRLVEVISGMTFDAFLEERLFAPLGMNDTAFHVPEEKHSRLVRLYAPTAKEQVKLSTSSAQDSYLTAPTRLSGGGGLVSTTMDYLRFCQMLLNNGELGGTRILGRKAVELMRTDHMGDIPPGGLLGNRRGSGFGLTFAVNLGPGRSGELGSAGEYSWGGAAGTRFWIDPEEELVGVFMVNILPYSVPDYGREFKLLTYQALVD